MNHDPTVNAKQLAKIEQNDKTVFYDTPGGVTEMPTPAEIKKMTKKTRKFMPEKDEPLSTKNEDIEINSRPRSF